MASRVRPTGVAALAILQGIGGLASFGLGFTLPDLLEQLGDVYSISVYIDTLVIVFLVLGGLSLITSFGLWGGKSWGRTIYMISVIISMLSLVAIPVGAIILYYLTRPNVKAYFGK